MATPATVAFCRRTLSHPIPVGSFPQGYVKVVSYAARVSASPMSISDELTPPSALCSGAQISGLRFA